VLDSEITPERNFKEGEFQIVEKDSFKGLFPSITPLYIDDGFGLFSERIVLIELCVQSEYRKEKYLSMKICDCKTFLLNLPPVKIKLGFFCYFP